MNDRTPTDSPTQHLATEDLPTEHWTPDAQDAPATQVASDGPPTEHVAFEDAPTSTVVPPAPEPATEILSSRAPNRRTRSKRLLVVVASSVLAGMLLAAALHDGGRPAEGPASQSLGEGADTSRDARPSADDSSDAPSASDVPSASEDEVTSQSQPPSGLRFPGDSRSSTVRDVDGPSGTSQSRMPASVDRDEVPDRTEMGDRIDRRL